MQFWEMILYLEDGGSTGLGVLHGGILVDGDESSRVILRKKLKMKLDTWTFLRIKTAQRILMMLPETLLSEMILWKLFMKDLGAEIKEDSLPNVTSEM